MVRRLWQTNQTRTSQPQTKPLTNPTQPLHRLTEELLQTAHPEKINALAFPAGYSEVFATAAPGCIRVWHMDTCRELLRVAVPNLECKCLVFAAVRPLYLSTLVGGGRGSSDIVVNLPSKCRTINAIKHAKGNAPRKHAHAPFPRTARASSAAGPTARSAPLARSPASCCTSSTTPTTRR
jgi:hypothetical protein